jgi:hypothetical protein
LVRWRRRGPEHLAMLWTQRSLTRGLRGGAGGVRAISCPRRHAWQQRVTDLLKVIDSMAGRASWSPAADGARSVAGVRSCRDRAGLDRTSRGQAADSDTASTAMGRCRHIAETTRNANMTEEAARRVLALAQDAVATDQAVTSMQRSRTVSAWCDIARRMTFWR